MAKRFVFPIITVLCAVIIYLATCIVSLPREFRLLEGENFEFESGVVSVLSIDAVPVTENINIDENKTASLAKLKAFGIPVKSVLLDILPNTEIIPWGATVGVRIDTDGVLVLGTGIVTDDKGLPHNPSEGILKSGDVILEADGKNIGSKEEFREVIEESQDEISLKVKRDEKVFDETISPIKSLDSNNKKLGVWVRDSTQGIGTVTYLNPSTNKFAALGHGIMDIDTKKLMSIKRGEIKQSQIVSVKKGKKGTPGELVGDVKDIVIGQVISNTENGIFGEITDANIINKEPMKIALQDKVHEGPAKIRSNVDKDEIRDYDVYIESVNRYNTDSTRGMVIRITDPELLSKTGGIVQGMSGSPIIQDNTLIGAVTHVFVQDPTKGYGIFIENMIKHENI